MAITEHQPEDKWREYIAAYWILKTNPTEEPTGGRIYADGCTDLICNAGQRPAYFYPSADTDISIAIPLNPKRLYLGGTMTAYGILKSDTGCLLTGIRFWPGGFYALFSQSPQGAVDSTIEFPDAQLCDLMQQSEALKLRLDQWFHDRSAMRKTKASKYDFVYLRKLMYESGGMASLDFLAKEMCVSNRTLERIFKENVGIPPKEFLRIVRFQEVLKRLRSISGQNDLANNRESLLQIAFELGYYDHAHLTNEFKKYAGILPSELSHFYKTRISDGQYF